MDDNLQQSKFVMFMKLIWPRTIRIINIIFYTIFTFIKNSINYMLEQFKSY